MNISVLYPPFSRIDKANNNTPFSGSPGALFLHRTLDKYPEHTFQIFPYDTVQTVPFIPGSRILCLGDAWLNRLFGHRNLNKVRGYRQYWHGLPVMATYGPMDCWEFRVGDDKVHDEDEGNEKDAKPTRRSNYLFWALRDFEKLLTSPRPHVPYKPVIAPKIDVVVRYLQNLPPDTQLSLDIETRIHDNCLDCIGFGAIHPVSMTVYVVPIYHYNNQLAYSAKDITRFWKALYQTFRRKDITIVGQNIAFDVAVLHHYYHLPLPERYYDTMLFMHRQWPLADRSLSHVISLYTDAMENHKNEICPNLSQQSETQLLAYNGKDVYWTAEAAKRQQELAAASTPAFQHAIAAAMEAQRTTLIMSFTGMCVDKAALDAARARLECKKAAMKRICQILTDNPTFNPGSAEQCAEYFYDKLDYEATNFTEGGAKQMDEETMYELQLKQDNPLFPLIVQYRSAAKQLSTLNFKPYKAHTSAL